MILDGLIKEFIERFPAGAGLSFLSAFAEDHGLARG
jgi:hypothetical protein